MTIPLPLPSRPLRRNDGEAALATIPAAVVTNPVLPSSAFGDTATALARPITEGGGHGLEAPGGLAAVLLWDEANGLCLKRLAVRPEHRRRGCAQHRVAIAAGEARRRRLPRLWPRVRAGPGGNRRRFARAGFAQIARLPHERAAAALVAVPGRRVPAWGHLP